MTTVSNPKMFIKNYYDLLIDQINTFTEAELKKHSTNTCLKDLETASNNPKSKKIFPVFNIRYSNSIDENYGVHSYRDPYAHKFDFSSNSSTNGFEWKSGILIHDYINRVRVEMIDELDRIRSETIQFYNTTNIKPTQNRLESSTFLPNFGFLVQSSLISEVIDLPFKLYLILIDFYLNPDAIKQFRYISLLNTFEKDLCNCFFANLK